ncbi:MAG TPA: hypothetical protein DDX19_09175, partial [Rhodopirellula baltica]|nr:hypothetical protein [Rhodopirellula baltica]
MSRTALAPVSQTPTGA